MRASAEMRPWMFRSVKSPCPPSPRLPFSLYGRPFTLNPRLSALDPPVTSQEKALSEFAQFAAKLKGDEKSEAQTFLFHLLAAFGHDANTLPEGSTFEYRVRLSPRAEARASVNSPTSSGRAAPSSR